MKQAGINSKKIALITGGGTGIGFSTAKALSQNGFHVILAGRRKDILDEAVGQISHESATSIACDVTDPSSVTALYETIEQTFERLDFLFNNAGVSLPSISIEDITFEDWKRVVDINLTGAFLTLQGAVKLMKKQTPKGGRIINNGSISSQAPRLYSAAYTSTKHAISGLTKSAALDCRSHTIAVGQIDIGNAETSMAKRSSSEGLQADGSMRPEPMMDVDNIAKTISFFANLPLDVNPLFLTILATEMPFVGRG